MKKDIGFETDSSVLARPHEQGKGTYWQKRGRTPLKKSIGEQADYLLRRNCITRRDRELLRVLLHMKVMSKNQLRRLLWPPEGAESTIDARVRKLYDRHLMARAINMMDALEAEGMQPSYVYMLDGVGEEILAREQGVTRHALGYKRRQLSDRLPQYLMHDLCLSECFVQMSLAIRNNETLGAVWLNEREASVRNDTGKEVVRPDGIMRLAEGERRVDLFLEMDRGATPWEEKLEKYMDTLDLVWGVEAHLQLLCVVQGKDMKRLTKLMGEMTHPQMTCLLKTWESVLAGNFLTGWLSVRSGGVISLFPFEGR